MEDTTFILLYRKLLKNPIFNNPYLLQLWIYCLLRANHKAGEVMHNFEVIKIKRGQFLTGRKVIAKDLNQNENTIYKRLKILEKLNYINIISNTKYSILTIIKYDSYQKKITDSNNKITKSVTSEQQAGNTNNNGNNDNNKNISDIDRFELFWNLFDKKVDRKKCKLKWDKINDEDKTKIIEVVPAYIKSKPDEQYRKNPLTYLNGECWNDEIILSPELQKELKEKNKLSQEAELYRKSYENYDNELKAFGVTE